LVFMELINIAHAGIISDAPSLQSIVIRILNFLLSVAGIIAIISLVISGLLYFFSAGNETRMERAKKSAQYSVIGITVVISAMVVVRFLGQFFSK
jgi:hypothetical protein